MKKARLRSLEDLAKRKPSRIAKLVVILLASLLCRPVEAYSVLSHEEVADLVWNDRIVPLLLAKYAGTTPDELREAHAYAYGGCIIQDLGYYPFGTHFFSDLLHYVRTGDFVANLITDSQNVNEYAFALGALTHYTSDSYGHPAVNRATAEEYPKLRSKFGNSVTYDDNPTAHIRAEFGFDVVEVAHKRYAPEQYHAFIGFQVAKPVLERAFLETYGLELKQVLPKEDLAIATYRRTVSGLIPKMTTVALVEFHSQLQKDQPSFNKEKFLYRVSRTEYERQWGADYQKPGVGARIAAFLLRLVPKVGPLKALALKMPDNAAQQAFLKSMNETVDHYREYSAEVRRAAADKDALHFTDRNLDTGAPTAPGTYRLADLTYAKLLDRLAKDTKTAVPEPVRASIFTYYDGQKNFVMEKPKEWRKVQADLTRLHSSSNNPP